LDEVLLNNIISSKLSFSKNSYPYHNISEEQLMDYMLENRTIPIGDNEKYYKEFKLVIDDEPEGGEYVKILNSNSSFYWIDGAYKYYNEKFIKKAIQ